MESFVSLVIFDSEGRKVRRVFNLRYVRHFDTETCRMMLNGARNAVLVDKESMGDLVAAAGFCREVLDTGAEHAGRMADAVCGVRDDIRRPWWKKLFCIFK